MKSNELNPMIGTVIVDEFVYGGKEDLKQGRSNNRKKKKIVAAVELNQKKGIKRVYFKQIENYSSVELRGVFTSHISKQANVKTDKWSGYQPIKNDFNVTQIKSNTSDFVEINTIIHQLKAVLRSVYSWMDKFHVEKYLNEYSYRINRSIHKQNIFDNLIKRMLNNEHISYQKIKIST